MACFASCKVTADSYDPDEEGVLTLNEGEPVRLKRRWMGPLQGPRISVEVSMRYRIVEHPEKGPWKISTTGWMHEVQRDGECLFAFHWHPLEKVGLLTPHLHAEANPEFAKVHIPTGRILIEDVLTVAEELGAEPLSDEWQTIMDENRERFLLGATWGHMST